MTRFSSLTDISQLFRTLLKLPVTLPQLHVVGVAGFWWATEFISSDVALVLLKCVLGKGVERGERAAEVRYTQGILFFSRDLPLLEAL